MAFDFKFLIQASKQFLNSFVPVPLMLLIIVAFQLIKANNLVILSLIVINFITRSSRPAVKTQFLSLKTNNHGINF